MEFQPLNVSEVCPQRLQREGLACNFKTRWDTTSERRGIDRDGRWVK
jgi:hypothetical protein